MNYNNYFCKSIVNLIIIYTINHLTLLRKWKVKILSSFKKMSIFLFSPYLNLVMFLCCTCFINIKLKQFNSLKYITIIAKYKLSLKRIISYKQVTISL